MDSGPRNYSDLILSYRLSHVGGLMVTNDLIVATGLQHIEISGISFFSFFQLCLYLTVWLVEDYNFGQNEPQMSFVVLPLPNFTNWGQSKMAILGSKMSQFANICFCSKYPKTSFGGLPFPKFAYLGCKKCPIVGKKCQNLHFHLLQIPQRSFGVLP